MQTECPRFGVMLMLLDATPAFEASAQSAADG